jgi:hypothetical protein
MGDGGRSWQEVAISRGWRDYAGIGENRSGRKPDPDHTRNHTTPLARCRAANGSLLNRRCHLAATRPCRRSGGSGRTGANPPAAREVGGGALLSGGDSCRGGRNGVWPVGGRGKVTSSKAGDSASPDALPFTGGVSSVTFGHLVEPDYTRVTDRPRAEASRSRFLPPVRRLSQGIAMPVRQPSVLPWTRKKAPANRASAV